MDAVQLAEWARTLVGPLLAVSLTALSAPVTVSRFRLWQIDRLNTVVDKTPNEDPARPYLEAERRKRAAWWAATQSSRMSTYSRAVHVFEVWMLVTAVRSIFWPDPVLDFPFFTLWLKIPFGIFIGLRVAFAFRRMRVDRVRFYNTLIDAGPHEFAATLRKPLCMPRLFGECSREKKLGQLPTRATSSRLEQEGVRTCPNGHPVTGGSVLVSDYDLDGTPPRSLLCGRCLEPLPRPLTSTIDGEETADVGMYRHRRVKCREKTAAEQLALGASDTGSAPAEGQARGA